MMKWEPQSEGEFDAIVIGAGFNGLYLMWRLRERGYRVHLYDLAPELGGVWAMNRYPGARVDSHIPNYEYSMEQVWRDWSWTERFPGGDELRAYFGHVGDVLDLWPNISLNARVDSARFDNTDIAWTVQVTHRDPSLGTTRSDQVRARFLFPCTGFASRPFIPDIAGLDRFTGPCHHTALWPRQGYDMTDQRVGVIGTGASGVQVVQEAAKVASQVHVFQRSPVTAIPMRQQRFSETEIAAIKTDYPKMFERRNNPPGSLHDVAHLGVSALSVTEEQRQEVYETAWGRGGFHFWVGTFSDTLTDIEASRLAYEFWRDKVRERIYDPAVAELLAPTEPPYPFGTKRPSLEQDYYDVFNQSNVALVDLTATPISEITEAAVVTSGPGGDVYPLDLLVLATGFDANTGGLTQIDICDTEGRNFEQRWKERVDTTYGMTCSGFPNLLFMYGPQSPTAFCNGPTCAELQGDWIVALVDHLTEQGLYRFESTPESDQQWSAQVDALGQALLFSKTDSWYMAANVPGKTRQLLNVPMSDLYLARLDECAANGYAGFDLS